MAATKRKLWIDAMSPSEVRETLREMLDEGFVKIDQHITAVLNPDNFNRADHEFPEDDAELVVRMADNMEWFCNVFRIIAVWETLASKSSIGLTFRDVDQILLWVYSL